LPGTAEAQVEAYAVQLWYISPTYLPLLKLRYVLSQKLVIPQSINPLLKITSILMMLLLFLSRPIKWSLVNVD
jgi:hypothetical protein